MRVYARGVAAAAAVLSMAGCGSTKTPAAGGLTQAQYITRADAACLALEVKIKNASKHATGIRSAIREITRLNEQADKQLQAIPKPATDNLPSEWLHWREAATADTTRTLKAKIGSAADKADDAVENRDTEKARARARAYGLTACALL